MPKRKILANFTCPGCRLENDSEISPRFLGPCGHSLCCNCVRKKKATTCPTCQKRGRFIAKHKKNPVRAVRMNSEENSVPAILDPEFIPFLYQVINQLDPRSFVKLARSCKQIYDVCFNSSEIKIYHDINMMQISDDKKGNLVFRLFAKDLPGYGFVPFDYSGDQRGFPGSVENRKMLKESPFGFKLRALWMLCFPLTETAFVEIRSLLSQFSIKSTPMIKANDVVDWEGFIQLVKDFRSDHVEIDIKDDEDEPGSIPDEAANYLLQNSYRFKSSLYVSDSVILNASVTHLELKNAGISQETFLSLLVKLANSTDEVDWKIGCQPFEFGHYNVFEVADANYDEEVYGPFPEARPLIFCERGEASGSGFFVMRKEGFLMCYAEDGYVVFKIPSVQYKTSNVIVLF